MTQKSWFEVDKEGMKQLWGGKPKSHVLRELIANAWDEQISRCEVTTSYDRGTVTASVEDDSQTGFRDLKDAYTLFAWCYKRGDPKKRGRFNIGEKQVFCQCRRATVETTTGTVIFDDEGRHFKREKRERGTKVTIEMTKVTREEYDEILSTIKRYLPPLGVAYIVNGESIPPRQPFKVISCTLMTETEEGDERVLRRTSRKTEVHVHKRVGEEKSYLYELGIPVQEINCDYHLDVQQRVPLSIDRETVLPSFLRDLYAEVLNATHSDLTPENVSKLWVREGMSDERVAAEAVKQVVTQRYGKNAVVCNPNDPIANDEAIAHGCAVIHGSEMSADEWANIRKYEVLQSSTAVFGIGSAPSTPVKPSESMRQFTDYAKRIAKRLLNKDIAVRFVRSPQATVGAQYGDRRLTVNVSRLSPSFFDPPVSAKTTDLILHELGHEDGHHTESSYHELITKMAGELVMLALREPQFFDVTGGC